MVITVLPDRLDDAVRKFGSLRGVEMRLLDQRPGLIIREPLYIERRGKAVEERRRVLLMVGERPQTDRRGEHRADVLATLHRMPELAQQ